VSSCVTLPLRVILFRNPLPCLERSCKQDADKRKGKLREKKEFVGPSWDVQATRLSTGTLSTPGKAPREEGLAFGFPWNGLIIGLAGFLSPDSLVFFSFIPFSGQCFSS